MATFNINSNTVALGKGIATVTSKRRISKDDKAREGGSSRSVTVTIDYHAFVGGTLPATLGMATVLARSFATDWIAYQGVLRGDWSGFADGDELTYDPASRKSSRKLDLATRLRRAVAADLGIDESKVTKAQIKAAMETV